MRTNIMRLELDARRAGEAWDVLEMREGAAAGEHRFDSPLAAMLADSPVAVAGVAFCLAPRRVLVAAPRGTDPSDLARFARSSGIDATCRRITWASLREESERDCLRLLWSMLGRRDGAQNVSGRIFAKISEKKTWVGRYASKKSKKKDPRAEAVFLEVCIGKRCELYLMVRTFTKRSLLIEECEAGSWKNEGAKAARLRKIEALPGFRVSEGRVLSSAKAEGDDPVYVMRKLAAVNDRNAVDFASFSPDKWGFSKTDVLAELLGLFSAVHGGYASVSFEEIEESGRIETYAPGKRAKEAREPALPGEGGLLAWRDDELPLRLVCAPGCEGLADKVLAYLSSKGLAAVSGRQGRLSLCCVPAKEAAGEDDPYAQLAPFPSQHLTPAILGGEAYRKGEKHLPENVIGWPAVDAALKELRIKGDVDAGAVRLFDWASLALAEPLLFASPLGPGAEDDGEEGVDVGKYAAIRIEADGRMGFLSVDDLYDEGDPLVDEAIMALQSQDAGSWCCVSPSLGCALGRETTLTTMPDLEAVRAYRRAFKAGDAEGGPRSEDVLRSLYGDGLDIAWSVEPKAASALYYASDCQKARTAQARATRLRRIESLSGPVEPWMDLLMPMLDVWFVKMRASTVRPFPLKYLDEWVYAKRRGQLDPGRRREGGAPSAEVFGDPPNGGEVPDKPLYLTCTDLV